MSFSRRLMTVRQFSSTADVTQTCTPLSLLSAVSSSSPSSPLLPLPLLSSTHFLSLSRLLFSYPACLCLLSGHFSSSFSFYLFIYLPLWPPTFQFYPFFFFPLSILSVEMSGWSEELCPGDCCAIRFSDGPDFVCMSVCT